jgi:hypothetical protein
MRRLIIALVVGASANGAMASDRLYEGTWQTTNRKLDGKLQCVVRDLGNDRWQGRFYGVWQGVAFDYTVTFTGLPADLHGTAVIDGASYTWTGELTANAFNGRFGGSRYSGHFELKEKPSQVTQGPK